MISGYTDLKHFLKGLYGCGIVEKGMASGPDGLPYRLVICRVLYEPGGNTYIFISVFGNQLFNTHSLQDAAGKPAAHKLTLNGDWRQPALYSLHDGIEAGEAYSVEKHIGMPHQAMEPRPVLPWYENNILFNIQAGIG